MPLLLCPNDNGSMSTVDRGGVQFDMCPTCRGVWLDRGELEKLMAVATEEGASVSTHHPAPPAPAAPTPSARPWPAGHGEGGGFGERGEYGERGEFGGYGRSRKRSIFDIFD